MVLDLKRTLDDRSVLNPLVLVALAALVVIALWDSFRGLAGMWQYSSYNHGYLVPLVSIYLLFQDRRQIAGVRWNGSLFGLVALAGAMALWAIGRATSIQAIEHAALPSIIIAFLWSVAGDRLLRAACFPLLYLYLAVPVGESLVPLLQTVTADVATAALNLFGIPAYRDGWLIELSGGTFEVAKACSGSRYLYAGIAMALLIAYQMIRSVWMRGIYVLLVGVLFIVMNGLRAFIVMIVASASDMRYMTGEDHVVLGYVLFLLTTVLCVWLAGFLQRARARSAVAGTG